MEHSVRNTTVAEVGGIIELSRLVYPVDVYSAAEVMAQLRTFPEGQFVALSGDRVVVGMSSSLRLDSKRYDLDESWKKVTASGTISSHEPSGDTLYGVDTMVHPDWRRHGVGTRLVRERFRLARRLGVRCIRSGIRLAGYSAFANSLEPESYVALVAQGKMHDPSLSFMIGLGFRVLGVARNYLERDPESAGCAAIIECLL